MNNPNELDYDVIDLGAGFAGIFTAEQLCQKRNRKVALVNRDKGILGPNSSSLHECYKLHTGVHYAGDVQTAVQCLQDSVRFARDFPEFILGGDDVEAPWRNGRHYHIGNSFLSDEEVKSVCEILRKTYIGLIKKDPRNKVFGEPEGFIRYLNPEDYKFVANPIHCKSKEDQEEDDITRVTLGIQTRESQIDINKFKEHYSNKLQSYKNLDLLFGYEVKELHCLPDRLGYEVVAKNVTTGEIKKITTAAVVNCTWQNIEKLDHQLGHYVPDDRIIRIKVSLVVELPKELTDINTCIFFSGPFCSITNLGNGLAIVTFEPVTNVGYYKPLDKLTNLTDASSKLLNIENSDLRPDEGLGKELADQILEGTARFIPAMKNAKVIEVRKGHVKIFVQKGEKYSLYERESPIVRRREDGFENAGFCHLSFSGMKMTFTAGTAIRTVEALDRHLATREGLLTLIDEVRSALIDSMSDFVRTLPIDMILYNTLRSFLLDNIELKLDGPHYKNTVETITQLIMNEIRIKYKSTKLLPKVEEINELGFERLKNDLRQGSEKTLKELEQRLSYQKEVVANIREVLNLHEKLFLETIKQEKMDPLGNLESDVAILKQELIVPKQDVRFLKERLSKINEKFWEGLEKQRETEQGEQKEKLEKSLNKAIEEAVWLKRKELKAKNNVLQCHKDVKLSEFFIKVGGLEKEERRWKIDQPQQLWKVVKEILAAQQKKLVQLKQEVKHRKNPPMIGYTEDSLPPLMLHILKQKTEPLNPWSEKDKNKSMERYSEVRPETDLISPDVKSL